MYLVMLQAATSAHHVAVHGYALMKTHVHVLVTPPDQPALSMMMKVLGTRYVRYFNRRNERFGTLWNERYRSILVTDDRYWLTCLRYIEQNPVRAGIVRAAEAYRWTSYRAHALGAEMAWLSTHPVYESLGALPSIRQAAYRQICGTPLDEEELAKQRFSKIPRVPMASAEIGVVAIGDR